MALTKVQIISAALQVLGKKAINSLGQDDFTNSAETAFDFLLPAEMESSSWRFATKIIQLPQVVITLPIEVQWRYVYQLPGDYLRLTRLYPQTWAFEIYGNQVYTTINGNLLLEYVALPDIGSLPASFVKYFIYAIAAWLAASNAQNPALTSYIEGKAQEYKMQAMAIDAQNRPQTPIQNHPMIDNRFVTTVAAG